MAWSWRNLFRYPGKEQPAMAASADRHLLGKSSSYVGVTPKRPVTDVQV